MRVKFVLWCGQPAHAPLERLADVTRMLCVLGLVGSAFVTAGNSPLRAQAARPPATPPASASQASAGRQGDVPPRALFDRYCVTCHNEKLKKVGTVPIALDADGLWDVPANAATWEKVVLKMRAGVMPPAGSSRPDRSVRSSFLEWLEGELDRAAAARPNPGRTEPFHRLNRAEYRNAVRDLLALDIDVDSMLPADDMSYGFDNNGGVLKMTPSLLDRYIATARHISRLAIGSPSIQPTAETFRLRADLSQDIAFDSLPMGTRGGTEIRYHFPLDGEYSIEVEPLSGGNDAHQLEISIDGERVKLFTVGARRPQAAAGVAYDAPDDSLEVRVPVEAGPRVVGVTFVKKTAALVETVREPFHTPHAEGGTRSQRA